MPYTQLNNLDFANVKTALKDYMRGQTDFTDYDFDGSAISQILDVLAYNTYYTAFNTNMVVNELFLDSATLRDNVVSLAKQLGYTPKSITAPKASVNMALSFSGTAPAEVVIKAGSGYVTNFDGSLYRYILKDNKRVSVANNVATFTDIPIYEGSQIVTNTVVDTNAKSQRFLIDNSGVDINTLSVRVFQAANSSIFKDYKQANNILDLSLIHISEPTRPY